MYYIYTSISACLGFDFWGLKTESGQNESVINRILYQIRREKQKVYFLFLQILDITRDDGNCEISKGDLRFWKLNKILSICIIPTQGSLQALKEPATEEYGQNPQLLTGTYQGEPFHIC